LAFGEVKTLKKVKWKILQFFAFQPSKQKMGNNSCECFPSHKLKTIVLKLRQATVRGYSQLPKSMF
jgi:hypothetical protein